MASLAAKLAQAQAKAAPVLGAKLAEVLAKAAPLGAKLAEVQAKAAPLGAKLAEAQAKASEATRNAAKHGCAYHKTLMEKNKKYVVDPPTIEKCQELSKQLFYTRLASIPGRYEAFFKEFDQVKQLLKNRKDLGVEHAGVAALFGIELFGWFCAGEIIGRGFTLTGYNV